MTRCSRRTRSAPLAGVDPAVATRHPSAVYVPPADRFRSPHSRAAFARSARFQGVQPSKNMYDNTCDVVHASMGLAPAEAAAGDVWAFIALVLLPSVAYWHTQRRRRVLTNQMCGLRLWFRQMRRMPTRRSTSWVRMPSSASTAGSVGRRRFLQHPRVGRLADNGPDKVENILCLCPNSAVRSLSGLVDAELLIARRTLSPRCAAARRRCRALATILCAPPREGRESASTATASVLIASQSTWMTRAMAVASFTTALPIYGYLGLAAVPTKMVRKSLDQGGLAVGDRPVLIGVDSAPSPV